MTESDKKKLPFVILLGVLVVGYAVYEFVIPQKAYKPVITQKDNKGSVNQKSEDLQVYEYTDKQGNKVEAIYEPEPQSITNERDFELSEQDKKIIAYMRSNTLLELQAINESLRHKRDLSLATNSTGRTGNITHLVTNSKDIQNFTSKTGLTTVDVGSGISNVFDNIELASISIDKSNENEVQAYLRLNGELYKAEKNKRLGDFLVKKITSDYVELKHIKSKIAKKISHKGFAIN